MSRVTGLYARALRSGLRVLYRRLRQQTRAEWDRDLPLDELLFDRWERARSLGFGAGASIYHSSLVYGRVEVGAETWIGPFTLLDGTGGLRIGRRCDISAGVQIYTHDTAARAVSDGRSEIERAPVEIGDCCFVGPQSVVAKGVKIGSHCVIGACSFVDRDLPDFALAAGVPCRPRGTVELSGEGRVTLHWWDKASAARAEVPAADGAGSHRGS